MDPPADDTDLKPETLEEEKESGPLFQCDFFDMDMVYKIGQSLLPGLASACIDNTIGGIFKTPASVAVDLRKEMVEYLTQRSESFVAESVVLEGGPEVDISVDPYDTISDFVDDFVSMKRNFFSRVSGWILSEKREDWIDDLVQEMELNGFWLSSQRNLVGQTLLKNLDFKNTYHCNMSFRTPEDVDKHKPGCGFRTLTCESEGCDSSFSAAQLDHHNSVCPFKILPCEQNCPDSIMRREMDRHCITICPMKLVKCPFHSMGCQTTIPQSTVERHRIDNIYDHLLYILQVFHKEASAKDLRERVKELEKLSSLEQLASTRDARSLTNVVKRLEARLGPLKVTTKAEQNEEDADLADDNKEEKDENPLGENEDEIVVSSQSKDGYHQLVESPTNVSSHPQPSEEEVAESASVQEEKPKETPEDLGSPTKTVDEQMEKFSKEENLTESPVENKDEGLSSPTEKVDVQIEKSLKEEVLNELPIEKREEDLGSPTKNVDEQMEIFSKEENLKETPLEKTEEDLGSPAKEFDEPMQKSSKEENITESSFEYKEDDDLGSPTKKVNEPIEKLSEEENVKEESLFEKKGEDLKESLFEKKGEDLKESQFEKKEED